MNEASKESMARLKKFTQIYDENNPVENCVLLVLGSVIEIFGLSVAQAVMDKNMNLPEKPGSFLTQIMAKTLHHMADMLLETLEEFENGVKK